MNKINVITVSALMLLSFVSCEKNAPSNTGEAVIFNVVSSDGTKTVYSGSHSGGSEPIYWKSGDVVRIYSATSNPKTADYKVDASGDGQASATISPSGSGNIKWSDGLNTFYAVYPSPSMKSGDEFTDGLMKGTVPATQVPLSLNSSSPYVASPVMTNEYMLSKTTAIYPGNVTLEFTPMTTAIEFTITNSVAEVLKIKEISLTSAGHDISGTFKSNLISGWTGTYPVCSAEGADGTNAVTMNFAGTVMESTGLAKDETLTFTVFLRPTSDADDLTFKLTKSDDSWLSTKLAASDGTFIKFPQYKKSYVKGLLIPGGAQWTVKYAPDVVSWNAGIDEGLILTDPYNGHEYVEIGDLKWATCNVGANTPKEFGWYFFWAGTTGYVYDGSKWVKASDSTAELSGGFIPQNTPYHTGANESADWKKYIPTGKSTYWSGGGSPDNILALNLEDDAARANWGGSWRMPTQADFKALCEACGGTGSSCRLVTLSSPAPGKGIYWVSADQNYLPNYTGAAGVLFCDGESMVFFVAAGYGVETSFNGYDSEGRYWSNTVLPNPPNSAYRLGFIKNDNVSPENSNIRKFGLTVRPVAE